jgi:excisionase family DNA binding protein
MNKLLSIREAAQLLGVREKTLYMWKWQRRGFPFVKIGRSVKVKEKDIAAFIERQTTRPI